MSRCLDGAYVNAARIAVLASMLCRAIGLGGNAIVVVIDGARYTETFGAEGTNVPHLWNDLRPKGTIWTGFLNTGLTLTAPGHAAIATGTLQDLPNDGSVRPSAPTLSEYLRRGSVVPQSSAAVIADKAKLGILTFSTHPDYGSDYGGMFVWAEGGDGGVYDSLVACMQFSRPRFLTVNLADVDAAGHSGDWTAYLTAIRRADSLIYDLWKRIQEDPFYRDSTTLIVTNDHGRHDDPNGGFQEHGDGCEGCRHILLLAVGRQIPPGVSVSDARTQCDIAPAVGKLLGIPTPFVTGTSLLDDLSRLETAQPAARLSPSAIALAQNYPNPFNPATTITFTLGVPINEQGRLSRVRLVVYDILGREIKTLVDGWRSPGTYQEKFEAAGMAAGVYCCRLSSGAYANTRKMILLR
jgi:hypothetical protein